MGQAGQHTIDKAVEEWQKTLRVCVAAGGGQFEHKMWTLIISDILYRFSDRIIWNTAVLFSKKVVFLSTMSVICYILSNCNYIMLQYL